MYLDIYLVSNVFSRNESSKYMRCAIFNSVQYHPQAGQWNPSRKRSVVLLRSIYTMYDSSTTNNVVGRAWTLCATVLSIKIIVVWQELRASSHANPEAKPISITEGIKKGFVRESHFQQYVAQTIGLILSRRAHSIFYVNCGVDQVEWGTPSCPFVFSITGSSLRKVLYDLTMFFSSYVCCGFN